MPDTMNPSTFLQVRENMERLSQFFDSSGEEGGGLTLEEIQNLLNQIQQDITEINEAINPSDPGTGGSTTGDTMINNEGVLQVYGVRLQTGFYNVSTTPNSYTRDVTFELKTPTAVGLNGREGFTGNFCLVITYKHNLQKGESAATFNYLPQQIAYGSNMFSYTRTSARNGASWGAWSEVSGGDVEPSQVTFPVFVESVSEPTNQKANDYWLEPI